MAAVRTLAIEINDSGLVVADDDAVLAVEPGYALADRGGIVTGTAAQGQARLKPHQVSNRFWAQLSLEPGTAGIDGARHAAELAYAQLRELWQSLETRADGAVFVVPGAYSREQLGLLLGLAEECGVAVRALIDSGAAASVRPYPGRQLVYVDAGLHRVSVTPVLQHGEAVAQSEIGLETTGLASVTDSLAHWFAEVFIRATRFDPFHRASSEQRLYDRLPEWLRELKEADRAELTLSHEGEEFSVTVERDQLLGVVAGFNRAVVQLIAQAREPGTGLVVQLSERLAELPGLTRQLTRLDDAEVVHLPAGHAARSALRVIADLGGGPVKLLKHMPFTEPPDAPAAAAPEPSERPVFDEGARPTHVVYRGIAYPADGSGLAVGRVQVDGRRTILIDARAGGLSRLHCEIVLRDGELRLKDTSRYGTFVNEKRVAEETVLHPADVIRIGSPGEELLVISVEDVHGTQT